MAEYIEREALLDNLRGSHKELMQIYNGLRYDTERQICSAELTTFMECIMRVKEAPAADVVEVRHGEWKPHYELFVDEPFDTTPYREQTGWKCSLCGKYEKHKEPYCNCGADMRGGMNE